MFSVASIGALVQAQEPGSLDPGFNGNGVVVHPTSVIDVGNSLSIQSDGRIVAAGSRIIDGESRLLVTRYAQSGQLDQTFGASGNYLHTPGSVGNDVVVRPNGEILIAGTRIATSDFLLVGLEADGSPNMDFQGGWISIDFGQTNDVARTIATDLDQRIYVAGQASGEFAIARFMMDGSLDPTFGEGGGVTTDFSGTVDQIEDIAILSNGSILAVGYTTLGGYKAIAIAKYSYQGELDTQFGVNGKVTLQFDTPFANYQANGVELMGNGKFIIAGSAGNLTFNAFLAGFNANGTLDATYGVNGIGGYSPGPENQQYWACRRQTDDKIVAVGRYQGDIYLARHLADGSLDPTFGDLGSTVLDIDDGDDVAYDLQNDQQGRIVIVANVTANNAVVPNRLALARFGSVNVGMIALQQMAQELLVYPNPVADVTMIQFSLSRQERLTLQLCDPQGKVLETFLQGIEMTSGEHQHTLTIPPDLASGNYLLVFSSPNGRVSVQVTKQ